MFVKGQSGNPLGRPKIGHIIPKPIDSLGSLVENSDEDTAIVFPQTHDLITFLTCHDLTVDNCIDNCQQSDAIPQENAINPQQQICSPVSSDNE
jgi:hypothetical protein